MQTTIRPYEQRDFEEIISLRQESWRSTGLPTAEGETLDYLRALFLAKIAQGSSIFVAAANSKIVGFVSVYESKVEQLFTAPAIQGTGVGKEILEFVKVKFPAGFWLTSSADNAGANRFYEREGMRKGEAIEHEKYGLLIRYHWLAKDDAYPHPSHG